MTITFRDSAQGHGANTAPTVSVPGTVQLGDIGVLHFSQNNTDVVTFTASGANLIHSDATSAAYPNKLYIVPIDGTTVGPLSTLAWTLSATRQWAISLSFWSGVNYTTSVTADGVQFQYSTTLLTMPLFTPTVDCFPVEVSSDKSNGTTITSYSAVTGYTSRIMAPGANTFGGASIIEERNAGLATAGTGLGGETYTPSSTPGVALRYIVPLNPITASNYTQSPTDNVGVADSLTVQASGWVWQNSVGAG